jgi:hypothetical protein
LTKIFDVAENAKPAARWGRKATDLGFAETAGLPHGNPAFFVGPSLIDNVAGQDRFPAPAQENIFTGIVVTQ